MGSKYRRIYMQKILKDKQAALHQFGANDFGVLKLICEHSKEAERYVHLSRTVLGLQPGTSSY